MTSCALPSARVGRLPKARVPSPVLAENSTGLKLMGAPLESRKVAVTATGDGFTSSSAEPSWDVSRVKSRPVYMKTRPRGRRGVLSSAADSRLACTAGTVFHSTVIAVAFGSLGLAGPAALADLLPNSNSAAMARIGNTSLGFHQRTGTDSPGSWGTATSSFSRCSRVSQIETMGNSLTIKVYIRAKPATAAAVMDHSTQVGW